MTKILEMWVSYDVGLEHTSPGVCLEESLAEGTMGVGVREAGCALGDGVREVGCALGEVEQNLVLWTGGDGELKHECYG